MLRSAAEQTRSVNTEARHGKQAMIRLITSYAWHMQEIGAECALQLNASEPLIAASFKRGIGGP